MKDKLVRITTIPLSLETLLKNQLRFMQEYYEVTAVSADKDRLEKVGVNEGVKIFPVELTRQITPLKDLQALWRLYKFFKKEQPLIVHSHTPKAGTTAMLAAKLAGVPHRLHTIAGLPLLERTGKVRKLLNFVEKITYACATKIYPNSFALKNIIIAEGFCKESKLKVLGNGSSNGIDTNFFNSQNFTAEENAVLKKELGIRNEDFVFIFVGRMVGDKGINELITAFCKLNEHELNVKLLLVGPFEQELDPLYSETLKEIESNKNIISTGYIKDVRPYFAIAHTLVFPSYREGFPNVVMQAGAMGLPSIVSNINGCNEIIVENENGFIIPVKNSDAIYKAMMLIMTANDLRNKLRSKAREMIVSRYEQHVIWHAILEEYQQLTN